MGINSIGKNLSRLTELGVDVPKNINGVLKSAEKSSPNSAASEKNIQVIADLSVAIAEAQETAPLPPYVEPTLAQQAANLASQAAEAYQSGKDFSNACKTYYKFVNNNFSPEVVNGAQNAGLNAFLASFESVTVDAWSAVAAFWSNYSSPLSSSNSINKDPGQISSDITPIGSIGTIGSDLNTIDPTQTIIKDATNLNSTNTSLNIIK